MQKSPWLFITIPRCYPPKLGKKWNLLSCVQLCDSTDYSPWGSSVHGILQARILKWVAISFSRKPWERQCTYPWAQKTCIGIFLVVQCLRICLTMQGMWVQSLVRELGNPTCHGATKPNCHNYWALALWTPHAKVQHSQMHTYTHIFFLIYRTHCIVSIKRGNSDLKFSLFPNFS